MKKIISFLIAILLLIFLDLLHFEAPPSASQNINGSIAAESLSTVSEDGSFLNFSFQPEFNSQNSGEPASMAPGQVFDSVTMLLLASGLIGLAGFGRKKI